MKLWRRLYPFLILVLLVTSGSLLFFQRENIGDWWKLRGYEAPETIAQLATDTAMTPYGKRLFYVNEPTLDDKAALNTHCSGLATEAAVLGCYRGNRQGIHIYDITDERLHGIEQVTAAHEMLHQAYDRLSSDERSHIEALLEAYYRQGLTDQSVIDKMNIYTKTEPDHLIDEMHSIFGTEIAALPAELDAYYEQYFTDRQQVVAYRMQSQAAFTAYQQQITDYDTRLVSLKAQIKDNEAQLDDAQSDLKQQKAQLDSNLAKGNVAAYNAGVAPYNAAVGVYNKQLQIAKDLINEYNRLVEERNALAVQATELSEALDSRLTPQ